MILISIGNWLGYAQDGGSLPGMDWVPAGAYRQGRNWLLEVI